MPHALPVADAQQLLGRLLGDDALSTALPETLIELGLLDDAAAEVTLPSRDELAKLLTSPQPRMCCGWPL